MDERGVSGVESVVSVQQDINGTEGVGEIAAKAGRISTNGQLHLYQMKKPLLPGLEEGASMLRIASETPGSRIPNPAA
jgi:hypothetical protein